MAQNVAEKIVDGKGLKAVVDNELRYTGAAATATVGGVEKGKEYENAKILDVLDDILHPYVAPTIGTVSVTPAPGVYENGATVNVTKVSAVITKGSKDITFLGLAGDENGNEGDAAEANAAASYTYTESGSASDPLYIFTKSSTQKYARIMVTDADGKSVTKDSSAFSFVYPFYYGVVEASVTAPTEAQIKALTKLVKAKAAQKAAFTAANQRMVFASPYNVTKIVDQNNFDVTGTFTKSAVSITGLDGTAQTYYVYTSAACTVTGFYNTFSV